MPVLFAGWPVTRAFLDVQVILTRLTPAHLTRRAAFWTEQNLLGGPFQENSLVWRHIVGYVVLDHVSEAGYSYRYHYFSLKSSHHNSRTLRFLYRMV